jgi:hypothetical protein
VEIINSMWLNFKYCHAQFIWCVMVYHAAGCMRHSHGAMIDWIYGHTSALGPRAPPRTHSRQGVSVAPPPPFAHTIAVSLATLPPASTARPQDEPAQRTILGFGRIVAIWCEVDERWYKSTMRPSPTRTPWKSELLLIEPAY